MQVTGGMKYVDTVPSTFSLPSTKDLLYSLKPTTFKLSEKLGDLFPLMTVTGCTNIDSFALG